jgi:hypothetical protein
MLISITGPFYEAQLSRCHLSPFTRGQKQIQFPKRRVSTTKNTGRWKKSKTLVILCAIHHRQNPSKSTGSYTVRQIVRSGCVGRHQTARLLTEGMSGDVTSMAEDRGGYVFLLD